MVTVLLPVVVLTLLWSQANTTASQLPVGMCEASPQIPPLSPKWTSVPYGTAADQVPAMPDQFTSKFKVVPQHLLSQLRSIAEITEAQQKVGVVIEVGSNAVPDFQDVLTDYPFDQFLVAFEPVVFQKTAAFCRVKGKGRCQVVPFAVAPTNGVTAMAVTNQTKCSSLLAPKAGTHRCHKVSKKILVPTVRMDDFLRYTIRPSVPIRLLAIDAQGYDLHVASSLADLDQRSRVANIMLECQDLDINDPKLLTQNASTCGMAADCIRRHWPGFELDGCWPNFAEREMNCGWSNLNHPLHDRTTRHPFNALRQAQRIEHPAVCPQWFIQERA